MEFVNALYLKVHPLLVVADYAITLHGIGLWKCLRSCLYCDYLLIFAKSTNFLFYTAHALLTVNKADGVIVEISPFTGSIKR